MVPIARPTCYSLVRHLWLEPIERAEYIRATGERQHAPDLGVPVRALRGYLRACASLPLPRGEGWGEEIVGAWTCSVALTVTLSRSKRNRLSGRGHKPWRD